MTAHVSETRPDVAEVAAFVGDVRERLSDLPIEERDDLLDGLEADLAEQLADGATGVLDDPASYAAELRAAAGLPATTARRRRLGLPTGDAVGRVLDRGRRTWSEAVERHPLLRHAWVLAVAARPGWWVLRAWVAVTLADQLVGTYEPVTVVPTMLVPGLGLLALVLAVVGSVLVGTGRLWPGGGIGRSGRSRVVLLVLNAIAAIALIVVAQHSADDRYSYGYDVDDCSQGCAQAVPAEQSGVVVDGRQVHNLFAYDAQGQPLTGVQLFDAAGRPVALTPAQAAPGTYGSPGRVVGCPWVNGTQRLYNVFPLPERTQRFGTCRTALDAQFGPAVLPTSPLAQVPPVALPTPAATQVAP